MKELMELKVGDDALKPLSAWQLHLMKSPDAYGSKIKESNIVKVDFPEEDGNHVYLPENPKVESFDYKITLGFEATNKENPASKIINFYNSLKGKKVIIRNLYKGVKLEGYATNYTDGKFYPNSEVVTFDITFYIPSGEVIAL